MKLQISSSEITNSTILFTVKHLIKNWEDHLLIIIVLYKIKLTDSSAFKSLEKCFTKNTIIFIYDNSPQPQVIDHKLNKKIIYRHDSSNPGVSKAYNEGHRSARLNEKKWIMLWDQDSTCPENLPILFSKAITSNPNQEIFVPIMKDNLGIISPFEFRWGRGSRLKNASPGNWSFRDYKFINSGMLISTSLFEKCNGYDEQFPLDFSDLVFIKRIMNHYSNFILVGTTCRHRLSSSTNSLHQTLSRFEIYVRSSRIYGKAYGNVFLQRVQTLLRSLKLSMQFYEIRFLFILFKN